MIGLIGALEMEIESLANEMTDRETLRCGSITFEKGRLYGEDVILGVCGVGKVNAAVYTDSMIHLAHPKWIINLGVGGAIEEGLNVGDVVVAASCVQHDMDTTPVGDPPGFVSGLNMVHFPCDGMLVKRLRAAAQKLEGLDVVYGTVATGDQFVSDGAKKAAIAKTFDACVCDMEGGAIAQACYMHGIPFAAVRAISDKADGTADVDFMSFANMAVERSIMLVRALVEGLQEV